ncbi:MAG: hypothetical protein IPN69_00475 [Acidobacteria bacterium]|nr:hypothetical protein [Acidobacteriota bacterium]MBK8149861.1 hypothetical protein [Acidobacteriota bacterium]MBK8809194.1 hypothetical protein [Acidobacteriota bacterium]
MSNEIFGVDLVDISFRGVHALMAAAWLLFDFIVFWLHFKIKDASQPIEERLERARVMHGIDTVVAYIFLLMLPSGIVLCYVTETPIFTTAWLSWKHVLYGLIIVDALYLLPISGTALKNLKAIKAGAENVAELNNEIRSRMNQAMPAVWLIWILVFAASLISVLNLKAPKGQEYIFRKTETVRSER